MICMLQGKPTHQTPYHSDPVAPVGEHAVNSHAGPGDIVEQVASEYTFTIALGTAHRPNVFLSINACALAWTKHQV